jgi:hypothetical protein
VGTIYPEYEKGKEKLLKITKIGLHNGNWEAGRVGTGGRGEAAAAEGLPPVGPLSGRG